MIPTSRWLSRSADSVDSREAADHRVRTPEASRPRLQPGEQYASLSTLLGGENLPELMRWLDE